MKKSAFYLLLASFLAVSFIGFVFIFLLKPSSSITIGRDSRKGEKVQTRTPAAVISRSVFVPYWSDMDHPEVSEYDTLIYFGISPDESGIDTEEPGYGGLSSFVQQMPSDKRRLLTVRMVNTDLNLDILDRKETWNAIFTASVDIAEKYKFDGIVLDLEVGALPFNDVTAQITDFVSTFSTHTKGRNLTFGITVFGDTIYRSRPYDLSRLGGMADEVYVMAYDFHKSRGLPGPNFPADGAAKYGYDLRLMADDMLRDIPSSKMHIVFGMFGYDWSVDEKGRPLKSATAVTLHEAREKFLPSCALQSCVVKRDEVSGEMRVTYRDKASNRNHIVWFEDEQSMEEKTEFLRKQGIGGVGYWAYGYF